MKIIGKIELPKPTKKTCNAIQFIEEAPEEHHRHCRCEECAMIRYYEAKKLRSYEKS